MQLVLDRAVACRRQVDVGQERACIRVAECAIQKPHHPRRTQEVQSGQAVLGALKLSACRLHRQVFESLPQPFEDLGHRTQVLGPCHARTLVGPKSEARSRKPTAVLCVPCSETEFFSTLLY